MGCVRLLSAAFVAAAAIAVCWFCVSVRPAFAGGDDETRTILFSGRDIWRNGAFLYGGVLLAPGGFEQDGFLLKLVASGGLYRYNAASLGGAQVIGAEETIQIMPGFRIKRGDAEFKFFFGPDIEQHRLWPNDPSSSLRGHDFGLRMGFDLWYEPTAHTMAAMDGSLSSIATNQSARVAFGWHVFDDQFYLGPETAYFGSDGYRHFRLGFHLTGLKTDNSQWSVAGGWARDSDGVSSPNVRLGLMQKM
jgi:cellulose biosynthesis protein BcsS